MSLLSYFLLLSLGIVHASPFSPGRGVGKVNLAISTRINTVGVSNFIEQERARVKSMKDGSHLSRRSTSSGPLSLQNSGLCYTTEVGIGTPPKSHTLLIDTGSSITWVGAQQQYVVTNSSVDTGNSVSVIYGSGGFFGEEWLDTVTLTDQLVIKQQSIGVASDTIGINGFDGILGLGPIDLTENSVNNTLLVPTVMDNLYAQKSISQEVVGVFFAPVSESNNGGELTFGGYNSSVMTSSVNYVPLTTIAPSMYYWGVNQSMTYGNTTILQTTSGIVDTGTTLIFIASDAFQIYQSLTGAVVDPIAGLLTVNSTQYANLKTLSFNIGGTPYGLTPNAQIWPRSLNTAIGGSSSAIYLIVANIGWASGSGFDFVNGYGFLERFYSVFDTTNQRIGFAETIYTKSETN